MRTAAIPGIAWWLAGGLFGGIAGAACDPAAACTPGTEACACRDGSCLGDLQCRSGACVDEDEQAELDDGDDGDASDDDAVASCDGAAKARITGALKTDVAHVVFDRVAVTVHHKRDIDEFEDGCVNFVRIVAGSGDGCELAVEAHTSFTGQGRLQIEGLRFSADSQCPDFPDLAEGTYEPDDGGLVPQASGIAGDFEVRDRNAAQSCVTGEYHVLLAGTLTSGDRRLVVGPTDLVVSGPFRSTADDRACPSF